MENKDLSTRLENIETLLKSQALNNKTVLSMDEVALYTGLSKQYLYKLTSRNDIPFYKSNGKVIRFSKSEVDSWLLRNRQSTNEEINQEAVTLSVMKSKTPNR